MSRESKHRTPPPPLSLSLCVSASPIPYAEGFGRDLAQRDDRVLPLSGSGVGCPHTPLSRLQICSTEDSVIRKLATRNSYPPRSHTARN